MRSPTAADIAGRIPGINSDFAGLSKDADELLSSEQIEWADSIFVMEQRQKKRLTAFFGVQLQAKRVGVLAIPDKYAYMDDALVALLSPKLNTLLRD